MMADPIFDIDLPGHQKPSDEEEEEDEEEVLSEMEEDNEYASVPEGEITAPPPSSSYM